MREGGWAVGCGVGARGGERGCEALGHTLPPPSDFATWLALALICRGGERDLTVMPQQSQPPQSPGKQRWVDGPTSPPPIPLPSPPNPPIPRPLSPLKQTHTQPTSALSLCHSYIHAQTNTHTDNIGSQKEQSVASCSCSPHPSTHIWLTRRTGEEQEDWSREEEWRGGKQGGSRRGGEDRRREEESRRGRE